MTEITAEGPVSTTTVIDSKNGTVPMPHMKVSKKSVSEDFVTTFSSPAAWLLVVALIVTWSAVAIVMFDLVDYKTLAGIHQLDIDTDKGKAEIPRGRSVNKLATDPLRIIHGAVEETTGWVYGSLSLLSDLIFEDEEESEKGEVEPSLKIKEAGQPPVKKKEFQIDKTEKHETTEEKPPPKEIHKEKLEKPEKPEKRKKPEKREKLEKPEKQEKPAKREKLEKPEKQEKPAKQEKPEKLEKPVQKDIPKVHKEKLERLEKPEKREEPEKRRKTKQLEQKEKTIVPPKEKPAKQEKHKKKEPPSPKVTEKVKPEQEKIEKKLPPKEKKSIKVEEKAKKDVKEGKPEPKASEREKYKEAKVEKMTAPPKAKAKEETALMLQEKSEKKDQYAFCRYMIDMFAHGDFYTGPAPHLFLPQTPGMTPAMPDAEVGKPNVTATKAIKEEKRKKVIQEKKAISEVKKKEVEKEKKVIHEKKIIPDTKKKDEKKKVTHEKKIIPEIKKKETEEEKKIIHAKKLIPEIKKKEVEEEKKVIHEKKIIPGIKKKEVEEEKKIIHEKKIIPEIIKKVKQEKNVTQERKIVPDIKGKDEKKVTQQKKIIPEIKKTVEDEKKVTQQKKIIPEIKKTVEDEKKVTQQKKIPEIKKTVEDEKKVMQQKKIPEIKKTGKKEDKRKALEKTAVSDVKKAEPIRIKPSPPSEKKEVSKTPVATKPAATKPAVVKQPKKEVPVKAAVAVEAHKLKEAEQAKQEPTIHLTKKAAVHEKKKDGPLKTEKPGLEKVKEVKPPGTQKHKDKELAKGKYCGTLKDKESIKRKEAKPSAPSKINGTIKGTDLTSLVTSKRDVIKEKVKLPVAVKEKVAVKLKEAKPPVAHEKKEPAIKKQASPAKIALKEIKEASETSHPVPGGKKAEYKLPTTAEKHHVHKHETVKQEKTIISKPERKVKQNRTATVVKTEQDAVKHEKEVQGKPAKSKETTKPSAGITVADKKKPDKPVKEKSGKTVQKAHLKEEKAKVPAVKKIHQHHNVTTGKISKASKSTASIRYYQCVFLNGYNGYTSQQPITPAQDSKGKGGQSKSRTLKQ
ncbi:triadin isoform X36 [Sphaerodactylus townsendi]|uniref:triadin isoform X36 n=1 Tax=Sphaerodactylus townsendi TaxID=933632 RepID=UPI002027021A|nr:triadin isoform X36 [Sphaerodactylus townsendi]